MNHCDFYWLIDLYPWHNPYLILLTNVWDTLHSCRNPYTPPPFDLTRHESCGYILFLIKYDWFLVNKLNYSKIIPHRPFRKRRMPQRLCCCLPPRLDLLQVFSDLLWSLLAVGSACLSRCFQPFPLSLLALLLRCQPSPLGLSACLLACLLACDLGISEVFSRCFRWFCACWLKCAPGHNHAPCFDCAFLRVPDFGCDFCCEYGEY